MDTNKEAAIIAKESEQEPAQSYYTDENGYRWKKAARRNAWGYLVEDDIRVSQDEGK